MRTAVIGSGAWGTALALALLNNGHQTTLWSYSGQEHATLREKRENPMLPRVRHTARWCWPPRPSPCGARQSSSKPSCPPVPR